VQTAQGSMLESLRAVEIFLNAHADKLDGVVKTGARQRLADAIAALEGHASGQTGSNLAAKGATKKKGQLRKALIRDHMAPIARIAKADLPATAELQPFRMPKGKPTVEKLAALATGMAAAAEPFAPVFISAGLPSDFIAQLHAAVDAMTGAVAARTTSRGSRRQATSGIKTRLSDGRKIVHILDAFVTTALQDDRDLLANWNLIKRVPKTPPGRQPVASPPPASAPADATDAPDSPGAPTAAVAPPPQTPAAG
jgi:hypothetical protein